MRLPGQRACANALLALGVIFASVFVVFSVAARFRTLYKDDWDWVAPLLLHVKFIDYVLMSGNEHIIVIPRAVMWLDYQLNGMPGPLMWVVTLGCYALTVLTLVQHVWRSAGTSPVVSRALVGATLTLLFFTYQLQVFLSPAGITIPLAIALAVGAMLATIRAARRLERAAGAAWWLFVALGFAGAAILTSGQGLAAPFALIAIVLTVGGRRVVPVSAACLVGAVAVAWLQARTTGVALPALDAHTIAVMALFGLAYFAGPLSYASVALGVSAGATVLALGIHEAYAVVRRGRSSSDCQLLCLGLMVFVVITAAMTAAARARFGIAQASQSRYALFAMLYMSTALVLWTIRMAESPSGLRQVWAVLGVTCALTVAMLPADLFIGAVWWAKAENARTAALALGMRVPDFEWIRTLHPDPMKPYERSGLMTLSDRIGDTSAANSDSQMAATTTLPPCEGALVLERVEPGRFFRMSAQFAAPADSTVFLQDGTGHTQGMANRLPIVNVPDPTYGQVITAVWHAVRGGRMHEPAWFGFAQPGGGPPFRAFVMNKGRIFCAAPVAEPR